MKTVRPKKRHQFVEDVEMRDPRNNQQWCLCGLPADNEVHEIPRRTDDERAHEARRMGERG